MDEPTRLSLPLQHALRDPTNDAFYSPASIWELGLKSSKGKLRLPLDITSVLESDGIVELPIAATHAIRTLTLPPIHFDPFDRMLIAQTLVEGLVLATRDALIHRYDVPVFEA